MSSEALEIIRLETQAIKALTAHIRAMIERLEERHTVPEPVITEEWDGTDSYFTTVAYPHRKWTVSVIPSHHNFSGDYYVTSGGKDLGEFHTFARAFAAIQDYEQNHEE